MIPARKGFVAFLGSVRDAVSHDPLDGAVGARDVRGEDRAGVVEYGIRWYASPPD
jgi:hypothetical protein